MVYTLGQYIVNVQSSTTSDGFSTIFIFGIWGWVQDSPLEGGVGGGIPTYNFAKISAKLHERDKILDHGGGEHAPGGLF